MATAPCSPTDGGGAATTAAAPPSLVVDVDITASSSSLNCCRLLRSNTCSATWREEPVLVSKILYTYNWRLVSKLRTQRTLNKIVAIRTFWYTFFYLVTHFLIWVPSFHFGYTLFYWGTQSSFGYAHFFIWVPNQN